MVEPTPNKNLIPTAIVIAGLIIAGAVIFVGLYGKQAGPEEGGSPAEKAAVVEPTALEEKEDESVPEPAVLEAFVQCLKDKGMKFYGAHWCGWCNRQRQEIGLLGEGLLYNECIDKESGEMTKECQEQGIQSFPTWVLSDGTKSPGYKPLENLAELSGCEL